MVSLKSFQIERSNQKDCGIMCGKRGPQNWNRGTTVGRSATTKPQATNSEKDTQQIIQEQANALNF